MGETDSDGSGNEFQLIEPTPEGITSFLTDCEECGVDIELAVIEIPGPQERGSATLSIELRNDSEVTLADTGESR